MARPARRRADGWRAGGRTGGRAGGRAARGAALARAVQRHVGDDSGYYGHMPAKTAARGNSFSADSRTCGDFRKTASALWKQALLLVVAEEAPGLDSSRISSSNAVSKIRRP